MFEFIVWCGAFYVVARILIGVFELNKLETVLAGAYICLVLFLLSVVLEGMERRHATMTPPPQLSRARGL
jgi:hypothetical protein